MQKNAPYGSHGLGIDDISVGLTILFTRIPQHPAMLRAPAGDPLLPHLLGHVILIHHLQGVHVTVM